MATYSDPTPDDKGGFTVQVRHPEGGVTFKSFSNDAEARAWIVDQQRMEHSADRFEAKHPRWRG